MVVLDSIFLAHGGEGDGSSFRASGISVHSGVSGSSAGAGSGQQLCPATSTLTLIAPPPVGACASGNAAAAAAAAAASAPAAPTPAPAAPAPLLLFRSLHFDWLRAALFSRLLPHAGAEAGGAWGPWGRGGAPPGCARRGAGGASLDLLAARGEAALAGHDASTAAALTGRVVALDPPHGLAALVHAGALAALGRSGELFQAAHALVEDSPKAPLAWHTVGCYYLSLGRAAVAARHFARATQLDPAWGHAWVGLGTAFGAGEETEPALAAFRTAARLLPAAHVPPLSAAALATRSGQFALARAFLDAAAARVGPGGDPHLWHEAGVLEYRVGNWEGARALLGAAAEAAGALPPHLRRVHEPTFFCYGHALRKCGRLREAEAAYRTALALSGEKPSTHAALGFTAQLRGEHGEAVACYHAALALAPEDPLAGRLLRVALGDMLEEGGGYVGGGGGEGAGEAAGEEEEEEKEEEEEEEEEGEEGGSLLNGSGGDGEHGDGVSRASQGDDGVAMEEDNGGEGSDDRGDDDGDDGGAYDDDDGSESGGGDGDSEVSGEDRHSVERGHDGGGGFFPAGFEAAAGFEEGFGDMEGGASGGEEGGGGGEQGGGASGAPGGGDDDDAAALNDSLFAFSALHSPGAVDPSAAAAAGHGGGNEGEADSGMALGDDEG